MVMPSKCPFCEKTYGDAEEHYCIESLGEEAVEVFKEFSDVLREESQRAVSKAIFYEKMKEILNEEK